MRARLSILWLPAAALLAGAVARADVVERRGGEPPLSGEVSTMDDEGVRVRSGLAEQFVPWDRVRSVQASRTWTDLPRRLERAETIWRARTRVERGDTQLAESLLERLFAESRGRTGPTSLVIAEGLLRCRLARGEQAGAIAPALETIRLRRAGAETAAYAGLPPVIDSRTSLCPALPPVLVAGPAFERVLGELGAFRPGAADSARDPAVGDPVVRALAACYRSALLLGGDGPPRSAEPLPAADPAESKSVRDHPGIALLRQFLACAVDGAAERASSRARLAGLELAAPWEEAWRRFALGASLLREDSPDARRRGAVELLHLPARHALEQPWLSGAALATAADALLRDGADGAAVATLRRELEALHPFHPLRPATATVTAPANAGAPGPAGPRPKDSP